MSDSQTPESRSEEIEIRLAVREDAAAMVQYLNEILDEGIDTIHPPRLTVEEEEEVLDRAAENGRTFFMLALKGPRIVGMANMDVGGRPHSRHSGVIGIGLLEEARGQGVGTRLMNALEEHARQWDDFCRIELEVLVRNTRAHALYKRLGYVEEGQKRKSANTTGTPEDTILMAKTW